MERSTYGDAALLGVIELAEDPDIETVTEIFIRVNSTGAALSQADFAMSKIAANESYGGTPRPRRAQGCSHPRPAPHLRLGRRRRRPRAADDRQAARAHGGGDDGSLCHLAADPAKEAADHVSSAIASALG
jgi:hypothetical protein